MSILIQSQSSFDSTRWSVILAAGQSSDEGRRALEKLCQTYWFPLYACARHQGVNPEDAGDLTQGFFARLITRQDLQSVDSTRGRFRNFLLKSFQNYCKDIRDQQTTLKRGGKSAILSFDALSAEERYRVEPVDFLSPEKLYDALWAHTLINAVKDQLLREYTAIGKRTLAESILPYLAGSATLSHAEVSSLTGLTHAASKMAASRMRKRFRQLLLQEVAATLENPSEAEDEIKALMRALRS